MFRKALYYPWIDIHNENWLRTAALYWSKLHTIVPESIESPYSSESARIMQDANILEPIRVNSRMRELEDIVPEVIGYLKTDEGLRVLMYDHQGRSLIHPEKLSFALQERLDIGRVHPDKMHDMLRNSISRDLPFAKVSEDGWLEMPTAFANFQKQWGQVFILDSFFGITFRMKTGPLRCSRISQYVESTSRSSIQKSGDS